MFFQIMRIFQLSPLFGAPVALTVLLSWLFLVSDLIAAPSPEPVLDRVLVLGIERVSLDKGVSINEGAVVVNEAAPPSSEEEDVGTLVIEKTVRVPASVRLYADHVQIHKKAEVAADLHCNTLTGSSGAMTTPLTLPVLDQLPPLVRAPLNGSIRDIEIPKHQQRVLAPGEYGVLEVGKAAKVTLIGGRYAFRAVKLGAKSAMVFQAPTGVTIEKDFKSGKQAFIGPQVGTGFDAQGIVFHVAGIPDPEEDDGANGDDDDDEDGADHERSKGSESEVVVRLGEKNRVQANFYAPAGDLEIGKESEVSGAFFARRVRVGKTVTLRLASAFKRIEAPDRRVLGLAGVPLAVTLSAAVSGSNNLVFRVIEGPSHGDLSALSQGGETPRRTATVHYTPRPGFLGQDRFTFEACAEGVPFQCAQAQVTIQVIEVQINGWVLADPAGQPPIRVGDVVSLAISGVAGSTGAVVYRWGLSTQPNGSTATLLEVDTPSPHLVPDLPGTYLIDLAVDDGTGSSEPLVIPLTIDPNQPPVIESSPVTTVIVGQPYRYPVQASDAEGDPLTYALDGAPPGIAIDAGSGLIQWTPDTAEPVDLTVIVTDDRGGRTTQTFTITVQAQSIPGPTVSAPLDPTATASFHDATAFLYNGPDALQTGVGAGAIEARRAAVIRGTVLDTRGQPLPGVTVAIAHHPEWGQTVSRDDGQFDLVVNGGGFLVVEYRLDGFLPVQRRVQAPWRDFTVLEPVVLTPLDLQVSAIDLNDTTTAFQVARGRVVEDAVGRRQVTVLFPTGTTATVKRPDGSTGVLGQFHVRATEYTVGDNGPRAMPGPLPPTSGYTYAVELSVDEAQGGRVDFDRPVYVYVDNFLGFPVGEAVPAGWYDAGRAAWVPSDDGRIIAILNTTGGIARLDVDGDGIEDSGVKLADLGITDAERIRLAGLYAAGQSLWRVPVTHFTPWDFNWPWGLPQDAKAPQVDITDPEVVTDRDENTCSGCIIQPQSQSLGEIVPVIGTPFSLVYQSERMPGYTRYRTIEIPLSGATIPASLQRIDLTVEVAGQRFEQSYVPQPNLTVPFTWDGLDAYGRPVSSAKARITISYRYPLVYYRSRSAFGRSFGATGGAALAVSRGNYWAGLSRTQTVTLLAQAPDSDHLGGWTLGVHHAYDPLTQTLYRGDGTQERADRIGWVIETVAGNGNWSDGRSGILATEVGIVPLGKVVFDATGNLYVVDNGGRRVVKVDTNGILHSFGSDGGHGADDVDLDAEGNVYIADDEGGRILRWKNGALETVVSGFGRPWGVTVAPDGGLYVADGYRNRVYKIAPDGTRTVYAGNGSGTVSGDGGPAINAGIGRPSRMALDNVGNLYVSAGNRIRKIRPDGIIETVATGACCGVAVDETGNVYYPSGGTIKMTRPDGATIVIAGGGSGLNEGGSPTGAAVSATDVSLGPDGALYITESMWGVRHLRIRKVTNLPSLRFGESLVPSRDGRLLYHFDPTGKHLETLDAITGVRLLAFRYDSNGHLSEIKDRDGRLTRIERDTNGDPLAIVAPDGQRTELQVNADGYLSRITDPAGASWQIAYTQGGLMTAFTDRSGHTHTYAFEADGRLKQDIDPLGGGWTLMRTGHAQNFEVAMTSGEGLTTRFGVERLADGRRQTVTAPDGTQTVTDFLDTLTVVTGATGAVTRLREGPDPRFGLRAPLLESLQITQPSGLRLQAGTQRTVTLADPTDPLSVQTWTETATVNGKTATRTYDATTRTWIATSPEGRRVTTRLDTQGRVVETRIPGLDPVRVSYDSQGRVYRIAQGTGPAERVSVFAYHPSGWLAQVTDPEGRATGYQYDLAGRVTRQTLPDGRTIQYAYDAEGYLTELTPPGRPPHRFLLDARHDPAEYQPPATSDVPFPETVYQLDLDRRPVRITRPDGQTLDFHYDSGGRLRRLVLPSANIDLDYDAAARLQSQTRGAIALTYAYDGDLPVQTAWSGDIAGRIGWTWNADFDLARQCVQTQCIDFHHDRDGLLTGAGHLTLSHDPQNGLLTATALGQLQTHWVYNGFGEVTERRVQFQGAGLYQIQLQRDRLGRIVQKTETLPGGETHSAHYTYDSAGRLIQADEDGLVTTWEYDANGNRIRENGTAVATVDDQDRLLNWKGITYTHSENGERKTKTQGGRTTTYTYDVLGNLTQVQLPDGRVIGYLIDPQGRRVGKTVDGVRQKVWLYQDDLRPAAQLDGQGRLEQLYVYGDQPNVPAYLIAIAPDGTQTPYQLITDHLGSVRLVVDAQTGQIAQRIDYDVWGNITLDTNPGFQPFGFAGGLHDPDTGLIRFGARDYDPETGRWTAKDPILFQGGDVNLYGYVLGDPVNWIDPSGNIPLDTLWDLGNIAWDLFVTGNRCDLAADLAALAVPYLPAGTTKLIGVARNIPGTLNIGGKQFSKKLNRRARELGLDPSSAKDRYKFRDRIQRVFNNADEVRSGSFRGQDGNVLFYRRGRDVVITKPNGDFITILTSGVQNKRFLGAERIR